MKGIVILKLNKKSELTKDVEYPKNICEEIGVTESMLGTVFEEHKKIRKGPNSLEMQLKRDLIVASFFTGHSSKHFIGKGDHVITVFLSNEDMLPRNFEGQVRRIAFELLPKRKEKDFKEQFAKYYNLLSEGELDAYWQEKQNLEQDLSEKKGRIDDLTQKVSMLVSDRSEHLRNVQALKSEVSELYTKLDDWSVQMAELNEYNSNLTAKTRELTELTNEMQMRLDQKDKTIKDLRAIANDNVELEESAGDLLTHFRIVKSENESLTQEIERLNNTNKKLKFQVLHSNRERDSNIDSVKNLKFENKKLKNKVLGVTNEKENINRKLTDLKKEIKLLRRDRDHFLDIVKEHDLL